MTNSPQIPIKTLKNQVLVVSRIEDLENIIVRLVDTLVLRQLRIDEIGEVEKWLAARRASAGLAKLIQTSATTQITVYRLSIT
jgi:FtsZ-binding cell division protein ZapB